MDADVTQRPARSRRSDSASAHPPQIDDELLLAVLGCVVEDRCAVYVSTPITTGPRFIEWRRNAGADLEKGTTGYEQEHLTNVIEPNRQYVQPLVESLRGKFDAPVIDPTGLEDVPGWEQYDYHGFWAKVVRRYVHTVVFIDGWQYSTGCVYEFLAALDSGATVLDERLEELSLLDAQHLVERAIDDISDGVLDEQPLRRALADLRGPQRRGGL